MDYKKRYEELLEVTRSKYIFTQLVLTLGNSVTVSERRKAAIILRTLESIFTKEELSPQIDDDIFKEKIL